MSFFAHKDTPRGSSDDPLSPDWNEEGESETTLAEKIKPKVKEPSKYAVVLHNDDYTTMEFVVEVLQRFFGKNTEQAMQIMLEVHKKGAATCGLYSFEIAETKVFQVTEFAREHGFPLKCTLEKR